MTQPQINQFTLNFPGQNNIVPRFGHLYVPNNTIADVQVAGFLDNYLKTQNVALLTTDIIGVAASDSNGWFSATFTNGVSTLYKITN